MFGPTLWAVLGQPLKYLNENFRILQTSDILCLVGFYPTGHNSKTVWREFEETRNHTGNWCSCSKSLYTKWHPKQLAHWKPVQQRVPKDGFCGHFQVEKPQQAISISSVLSGQPVVQVGFPPDLDLGAKWDRNFSKRFKLNIINHYKPSFNLGMTWLMFVPVV